MHRCSFKLTGRQIDKQVDTKIFLQFIIITKDGAIGLQNFLY